MNFERLIKHQSIHQLRRAREWFRYVAQWRQRREIDIQRLREELSPIFVIGANRSGTSVLSYLMSQHPDLEGIFCNDVEPQYAESGHSLGFCESMHVWRHLVPDPEARWRRGHLPFWGLPSYIGQTYRDHAFGDRERRRLAWDVVRNRRTDKMPLIKNNLNSLRVGLITDVFPRARFVLICRPLQDFTSRSIKKWSSDGSGTAFDRPLASFHWNMVNLVARYDLEIFAPGRYAIVSLDELTAGPSQASDTFARIAAELSLSPHVFDFTALAPHWKGDSALSSSLTCGFEEVRSIVESERQILSGIHSHPGNA